MARAALPVMRALRNAVAVANRPTPVARPSRPSMGLKALAHPTSQKMVSGMCHQVFAMLCQRYGIGRPA